MAINDSGGSLGGSGGGGGGGFDGGFGGSSGSGLQNEGYRGSDQGGGNVVGAAIGGAVDLYNARRQRQATRDLTREAMAAAERAAFPYGTESALGSTIFTGTGPDRLLEILLNPRLKGIQDEFLSAAEQGNALSPEQQQLAMLQRGTGLQALNAGGGLFSAGGQAMSQGRGLFSAGAQTDPMQIAQQQMQREMSLLQPYQSAQNNQQQARLYNQGLLGSTIGQGEMEGQRNAQQQQQMEAARRSMAGGLDYTGQLFSRGMQGMQLGGQMYQGGLAGMGAGLGLFGQAEAQQDISRQRQLQTLQAATGMEQQLLGAAELGIGAASGQVGAGIAGANFGFLGGLAGANQEAAFGNSFANSLRGMNFNGGNQSGVSGVNSGSQQDQMLFEQTRDFN